MAFKCLNSESITELFRFRAYLQYLNVSVSDLTSIVEVMFLYLCTLLLQHLKKEYSM